MRKTAMNVVATFFTLLVILLFLAISAMAQSQYPVHQFWAADYGGWSIPGQGLNNFAFPSGSCRFSTPGTLTFFPFNANAPVAIIDTTSSPANEIVTVSSVVNLNSQCGFSATPASSHYSFQVTSGTGGLQEALNAVGSSGGIANAIFLDTQWYNRVKALPSGTAASIIAAAVGNTNTILVDETTSPFFTFYSWNGAQYVKQLGGSNVFNSPVPSTLTVQAVPTAPVPVAAAPTGIAAATYRIAATYVDALGGETLISSDASSTVTTTAPLGTITVPSPAAQTGAVGWRLYVSAAAGGANSEIFYAPASAGCTAAAVVPSACAIGSNAVFNALITGTAAVPAQSTAHATAVTAVSTVPTGFQKVWGPFTVTGVQTAATSYNEGTIPIPAGFFNTLLRQVRICGNINQTPVVNSAPTYTINFANGLGVSPVALASFVVPGTTLTAVAEEVPFCVNVTTTATGAAGTFEVHGNLGVFIASTGAPYTATSWISDGNTAAVSPGDLTKAGVLTVVSTPATANITQGQLRQLTIEVLQ